MEKQVVWRPSESYERESIALLLLARKQAQSQGFLLFHLRHALLRFAQAVIRIEGRLQ